MRLLTRDVNHRLGCGPVGVTSIREHDWFKSLDWGRLEKGSATAPYTPKKEVNAKVQNNITTACVMRLDALQAGGGEGGHADHITFTTWDFGGQVNGPTVPCLEFIQ